MQRWVIAILPKASEYYSADNMCYMNEENSTKPNRKLTDARNFPLVPKHCYKSRNVGAYEYVDHCPQYEPTTFLLTNFWRKHHVQNSV